MGRGAHPAAAAIPSREPSELVGHRFPQPAVEPAEGRAGARGHRSLHGSAAGPAAAVAAPASPLRRPAAAGRPVLRSGVRTHERPEAVSTLPAPQSRTPPPLPAEVRSRTHGSGSPCRRPPPAPPCRSHVAGGRTRRGQAPSGQRAVRAGADRGLLAVPRRHDADRVALLRCRRGVRRPVRLRVRARSATQARGSRPSAVTSAPRPACVVPTSPMTSRSTPIRRGPAPAPDRRRRSHGPTVRYEERPARTRRSPSADPTGARRRPLEPVRQPAAARRRAHRNDVDEALVTGAVRRRPRPDDRSRASGRRQAPARRGEARNGQRPARARERALVARRLTATTVEGTMPVGTLWAVRGAVAQLVERNNRTVEARGSIPLSSTNRPGSAGARTGRAPLGRSGSRPAPDGSALAVSLSSVCDHGEPRCAGSRRHRARPTSHVAESSLSCSAERATRPSSPKHCR